MRTFSYAFVLALFSLSFFGMRSFADEEKNYEYPIIENPFSDVVSESYVGEAVIHLNWQGIMSGYPDGTLRTENNVLRAEMAKMIALAEDLEEGVYRGEFLDVSGNSWFAPYVAAVFEAGIIKGYPDGTFGPGKNITRAEFSTIIARLYDTSRSVDHRFRDVDSEDWFHDGARAALYYGMFRDSSYLNPSAFVTREEVILTLYHIQKIESGYMEPFTDRSVDMAIANYKPKELIPFASGDPQITYVNGPRVVELGDPEVRVILMPRSVDDAIRTDGDVNVLYTFDVEHLGGEGVILDKVVLDVHKTTDDLRVSCGLISQQYIYEVQDLTRDRLSFGALNTKLRDGASKPFEIGCKTTIDGALGEQFGFSIAGRDAFSFRNLATGDPIEFDLVEDSGVVHYAEVRF